MRYQLDEIDDAALLARPLIEVDRYFLDGYVAEKRFAVTGAGGSIGSELCRRLLAHGARTVLAIDNHEPSLCGLVEALSDRRLRAGLADVRDMTRLCELIGDCGPDVVIHAAALKHVPVLETDWREAVKTNVLGSMNVCVAAASYHAKAVLISTDKAVEPVSVLGVTKLLAERYFAASRDALAVRFGNVLYSSGSVVPKFHAQMARGGPITITDPGVSRYFMTAQEACDLVLAAAAHSTHTVYMLDAGDAIPIPVIAGRLKVLCGRPDIGITFTGLRPGERLTERLIGVHERAVTTEVPGLMGIIPTYAPTRVPRRSQMIGIQDRDALMRMARFT